MNVLTVNLLFSTLIFWIAAKIYLLPVIDLINPRNILIPILLLHSFRHLGLMFLSDGATYSGIPLQFAYPAAFGDLIAAVLALAAIPSVIKSSKNSLTLVRIFNYTGSIDLIAAIILATVYGASDYMGPAYWIPAFWVPALLVTHYIIFLLLFKQTRRISKNKHLKTTDNI